MSGLLAQTIRVIVLTTISFFIALFVTPLWYRFIKKKHFGKQIREESAAPVFYELHKKKEGTPTGGGIIIWSTVVGLAALFGILNKLFDGRVWHYLNFINRGETYLPLAALLGAALIGLAG